MTQAQATAAAPVARVAPTERVVLRGDLTLRDGKRLWQQLRASLPNETDEDQLEPRKVSVDMSGVNTADASAAALLATFRAELIERGIECDFIGANSALEALLRLYEGGGKPRPRKKRKPIGLFEQVGAASIGIVVEFQLVVAFFGQMMIGFGIALREPRTVNWKELMPTMERAGADATPIVVLVNLLVGMVIALQSAGQLHRFGADIFLADLIGISIVREIGPLMTAILVCGRTGAAFAAELGSMKTNEEIDALRTMGFGPMRFLVMPRALGLMLVAPLLTVVADLAGGIGGLLIGISKLDLSVAAYLAETKRAVHMHDLSSGLIKSVAFALAIALISCQQGLAATGGAEGVGRRTTSAVVTTLFALILIDAVFTVFFSATGAS
jgi:phospholipid/cholesterol/gamma-HCH transport system permease protein